MNSIKNIAATFLMIVVLLFGTTFANAGIIIAGAYDGPPSTDPADPCAESATSGNQSSFFAEGIIIAGAKEVASSLSGIIIAGATSDDGNDGNDTCGIIIAGA